MWRSVRQTAHARTRTSTCPSPGSGSGSSRSRKGSPGASRTMALIAPAASERELGARRARALVPCDPANAAACLRLDDPLDLGAIRGRVVVPPPHESASLDATGELTRLLALLTRDDPGAFRELEQSLDRSHVLAVERLLRHVRRQPARVLEH